MLLRPGHLKWLDTVFRAILTPLQTVVGHVRPPAPTCLVKHHTLLCGCRHCMFMAACSDTIVQADAAAGEDAGKHHPALLRVLGQTLGLDPSAIVDFDLNVCDTQPGTIGGESLALPWSRPVGPKR